MSCALFYGRPKHMAASDRISLLPAAPSFLLTLIGDPARFRDVTGVDAADGLRAFYVSGEVSPEWLASLRTTTGVNPWHHGFFVIEAESGQAIGGGGFKGEPDELGVVEIAYGIVPAFERRGFATDVARALVGFASDDTRVTLIRAHTRADNIGSRRVLEKAGFAYVGEVDDPDDGVVMRWERMTG